MAQPRTRTHTHIQGKGYFGNILTPHIMTSMYQKHSECDIVLFFFVYIISERVWHKSHCETNYIVQVSFAFLSTDPVRTKLCAFAFKILLKFLLFDR